MTEYILAAVVGLLIGMAVSILLDAKFWWSFAQEVYYHHPGNHRCNRVGCCR